MAKAITIIAILVILLAGGFYLFSRGSVVNSQYYGSYGSQPAPSAPANPSPQNQGAPANNQMPAVSPETNILQTETNPNLGMILTATNGMTLYKFASDTAGVSNCTGQCATIWPPYTLSAGASLKGDTNVKGTIATITRSDGTMQITYNGMPLYFYSKDMKSGDTNGQGIGGVWSVVNP